MTLKYIRNHNNIDDRIEWGEFFYLGKKVLSMASCEKSILPIRFELKQKDLLLIKELAFLQDKDYNAFGIPLPKCIILEVLDFHKNHNDEFSLLVNRYPFSQLIFSQWQSIKLYERHKELTNDTKLNYKNFMNNYFSFTYNGRTLSIYEAIVKMKLQEKNNVNDESYSIVGTFIALESNESITLYDFIYDIIPNSIKIKFLKDEATMKSYLQLKTESFEYTQNILDKEKFHTNIYGIDKPFNEDNIKKEWYRLNALNLKGYDIDSKELIVAKSKQSKIGIGYDEILELINNKKPELLDITEGMRAENDMLIRMLMHGEIDDIYAKKSALKIEYDKRLAHNKSILINNNFDYNKTIFESLRVVLKEAQNRFNNGELDEYEKWLYYDVSGLNRNYNQFPHDWYGFELRDDCYYAYRFNQALALAFVNAYNKNM